MKPCEPPRLARWLLRVQPLGGRRAEIQQDLLELYANRVLSRGERYARRRYYGDVLSVWRSWVPSQRSRPSRAPMDVLHGVGRDLWYAARLLRRTPSVVLVTVGGLAIAISVTTAIFSVVSALVLRQTGIDDPSSVLGVQRRTQGGISTTWPYVEYVQLAEASRHVRLEAATRETAHFSESARSDVYDAVVLSVVTGGYLEALSRTPDRGRWLHRSDERMGAHPVAVVSHRFWSRRLGADANVIGRTIWLNGTPVTIVGVAGPRFTGRSDVPPAFWVPLALYHNLFGGAPIDRSARLGVDVVGRFDSTVSAAQVEAELNAIAGALAPPPPGTTHSGQAAGVRVTPPDGGLSASERRTVALVVIIVGVVIALVLLLACLNVANLLFASTVSRRREIGLRIALGATRARVMRQLLTESLSLGLAAGAAALLLTTWFVPLLVEFAQVPATVETVTDLRVLLFLATVSIIAGLGAGLLPSRDAVRGDLAPHVRFSPTAESPRSRFRSIFISLQAGTSLFLLVLAALLTRGMSQAMRIDVGFDADRLVSIGAPFDRGSFGPERARTYWESALERVRGMPEVRFAALAEYPPFGGASEQTILNRPDGAYRIYTNATQAEYFQTAGLRIVRGRSYTPAEVVGGANVAVISEALAQDFYPNEDPVGQSLERVRPGSSRIIIGVVSNAITARLRELSTAAIYQPLRKLDAAKMLVRVVDVPEQSIPRLRSALQSIDRDVRVEITPVRDGLRNELEEPRILAALSGTLAGIALALAAVGMYGVTAFVVTQRLVEVGVRMALGATARDVLSLLLSDSLRAVLWGLALGLVAALLGTRVLAGMLYGLGPADPLAYVAAVAVLLIASVAAVLLPARRAARVDPAVVLRQL